MCAFPLLSGLYKKLTDKATTEIAGLSRIVGEPWAGVPLMVRRLRTSFKWARHVKYPSYP